MAETGPPSALPVSLTREGNDHLVIVWSDGLRCALSWRDLRAACPCAACREERAKPPNPLRVLSPAELVPLAAVSMPRIGRYAYKIVWSDGHDTGIYTLQHLRALCEQQAGQGTPPSP